MNDALSDLFKNVLLVVGALFPIVNPVGNTPIFLSLTRGLSGQGRAALARMIALNGLILILASIFIGTHILAFFGISLPVAQVGGGLIVISTGWALLPESNDDEVRVCGNDLAQTRPSTGKRCYVESRVPIRAQGPVSSNPEIALQIAR